MPRTISAFLILRKAAQDDFAVPYFKESRPKRFSPFLILRKAAQNKSVIPYHKESRPEQFRHSLP